LTDLADYYGDEGLYGSWIRDLRAAAANGCKNRRQFRTVVADIFGSDKNSGDMHQMANCAKFGHLYDVLSGKITYDELFGLPPAGDAS
jgi:hypothetical protein